MPPTAPQNLTATLITGSQIDLAWTPAQSGDDPLVWYRVYRGATPVLINRVDRATLTYSDRTISAGNTYTYEVRALDTQNVESSPSNSVELEVTTTSAKQAELDTFLKAHGVDGALLIVEDQEIDILDAVVDNYRDLESAYAENTRFDTSYQDTLSENEEIFIYIPRDGLHNRNPPNGFVYGSSDLDDRAFYNSRLVFDRLHFVFQEIARTAAYFESVV